jgi:hypothetical protein
MHGEKARILNVLFSSSFAEKIFLGLIGYFWVTALVTDRQIQYHFGF